MELKKGTAVNKAIIFFLFFLLAICKHPFTSICNYTEFNVHNGVM